MTETQQDLFDAGTRHRSSDGITALPGNYPLRSLPTPDIPGTGPIGEVCLNCRFYNRVRYHDKVHLKCDKIQDRWTHGPGTDIRASWPACSQWEPAEGYVPLELCPPGFPLDDVKSEPGIAADWWEEAGFPDKAERLRRLP